MKISQQGPQLWAWASMVAAGNKIGGIIGVLQENGIQLKGARENLKDIYRNLEYDEYNDEDSKSLFIIL